MGKEEMMVNLEEDLNEISSLIWSYMDKKYIHQLKAQLSEYRISSEQNLCKEAQLMRAMMPFLPQKQKLLEFMVEATIYNDMIERSLTAHKEMEVLYRDEDKEKEKIKKLMYKLIVFKLMTLIEKNEL